MPAVPSFHANKPCADCGKLHATFLDNTSREFWLDLDIPMEDLEQWSADSKQFYVPPDKAGRPQTFTAPSDSAAQNRERQARYQARKKAEAEGKAPPKWAKKRAGDED